MRKEASLEQWGELYDATLELLNLEPWTRFWDMDLIAVQPGAGEEPIFCSIMGRAGSCYGVGVYPGLEGLRDLRLVAGCGDTDVPAEYIMFEQSSLCCYCGDADEVPPQQKEIMEKLGLGSDTQRHWVYFHSFRRRYFPWTPDESEVRLLTDTFRALADVVREARTNPAAVNFDGGHALWRIRDEKTGGWTTCGAPLPDVHKTYPEIVIQNDLLRYQLKKCPWTGSDLLMDFSYINTPLTDPQYDRPSNPLLFLVIDRDSGMVIHTKLLEPADSEIDAVLEYFTAYIREKGRMHTVCARNPWVFSALSDICAYCGIALEEDPLELVDRFLADFKMHASQDF